MIVEENIQTPSGTGEPEGVKPEGGESQTPTGTETEVDYKTKFTESSKEALRLKTELDNLKAQKPSAEVPEDEKRVREVISKIEIEKAERTKQEEAQLRKELDDLHTIYGDYDEGKLMKIVDRYGVYDENDKVNWYSAMELYEKLGEVPAEPPKPKTPQTKREGAAPQPEVVALPDVSKKSLPELVQEGLKKFGL